MNKNQQSKLIYFFIKAGLWAITLILLMVVSCSDKDNNLSTGSVPGVPGRISLGAETSNSLVLNWSAPEKNSGETIFYVLEYSNAATSWMLLAPGSSGVRLNKEIGTNTSAKVEGLTPGITYVFRVIAISDKGISQPTDIFIYNYYLLREIIITPSPLALQVTSNAVLTASFIPNSATNTNLIWTSGNAGTATVLNNSDGSAVVTGVSIGTVVITAKAQDVSSSVTVDVREDFVRQVTLSTNRITLITNTSVSLTTVISPITATNKKIIWSSSDVSLATVTASSSNNAIGIVTGMSPGTAVITAAAEDGGWQDTADVTVRDLRVTNVTLDKNALTIEYRTEGDTETLNAAVLPADAFNQAVRWESSDNSIAAVTNGVVYPVKSGTVTITAISEDDNSIKATAAVTVIADWALRLSFSPAVLSLEVNSNETVTASFYPISATNFIWTSGNEATATVSNNGDGSAVVTGVSIGSADITVSAGSINSKITINVTPVSPGNLRQNLTCSVADSAELLWDASPGADKYEIYRVENGAANKINSLTTTSYTATGLTANTYYRYEVRACFGDLCSPPALVTVLTGPAPVNNLASIIAAGQIPNNLNNYDQSYQDIFGGYSGNTSLTFRYILPGGAGNKNGSSWSNAADNLRTVLNGISDAGTNKVYAVLIKPGTYQAGDEMVMKNYVTIAGGVTGCNTIPSNKGEDITVLSGNNSYRVFNNNGLTNTARLYRVTIADGNTTGNGGGMDNNSSSPVLTEVVFSSNTASLRGGGMANENSTPVLTGVVFSGNTAMQSGGGMYNKNSSPVLTDVVFSSNTVINNFARGGGMDNENSTPVLNNVVFSGNTTPSSGGGMYNNFSTPVLTGVVFSGNTAMQSGGGMINMSSTPVLTGVVFSGNTAFFRGGGMINISSTPVLTGVVFSGNTANQSGGGMDNFQATVTVVNSIFWGNSQTGNPGGANVYYSVVEGGTTDNNNITTDPQLGPLTDNGGGIDTMTIPTTSPAVNKGIFVKRSAAATGRDAANNPTYTFYYSIDKTSWYTTPALTGATVNLPGDEIDLTAFDMTGYPVTGRPDIGVYEAR